MSSCEPTATYLLEPTLVIACREVPLKGVTGVTIWGKYRGYMRLMATQTPKYVKQSPFGSFWGVLGHYFTYF